MAKRKSTKGQTTIKLEIECYFETIFLRIIHINWKFLL